MGNHIVKIACQLSFDEQQEVDIIRSLELLSQSHKIGQFLSNIIRLAFDSPEVLERTEGAQRGYLKGPALRALDSMGLTHDRKAFIDQMKKRVDDIQLKVDDMYSLAMKTYMLGLMGKHIGIEEKSDNQLMAQFIIETQLKELQDSLGVSLTSNVLASNKKKDIEKIANEALEYIIESYSGIVGEIKAIASNQVVAVQNVQSTPVVQQPMPQSIPQSIPVSILSEVVNNQISNTEQAKDTEQINDEGQVEFIPDADDLSALSNFFGE